MATTASWKIINEEAKRLLFMGDAERIAYINRLLDCCETLEQQAIISFFYIYGMRPEELLRMSKSNMSLMDNVDGTQTFRVLLPTVKEGNDRIIDLNPKTTPFIPVIVEYLNVIDEMILPVFVKYKSPTSFNKLLEKVGDKYHLRHGYKVCVSPYVFRKFRISNIYSGEVSGKDLLAWKGGKSIKSVEDSYLFLRPVTKFKDTLR